MKRQYYPNKDLHVKEINKTFTVGTNGTVYTRVKGALQKVAQMRTKHSVHIGHDDYEILIGSYDVEAENFNYTFIDKRITA